MLSVLIPIHNYTVTPLVTEVHRQLSDCNIMFEIICLEDGSNPKYINTNTAIERLSHTKHIINKTNIGRTQTRQELSNRAQFEWLLFLDADVLPFQPSFISNYLKYLTSNYKAILGGINYKDQNSNPEHSLRWKYGKRQEVVDYSIRNKKPYKSIVSANILIKKSIFTSINNKMTYNAYGYDNYFGSALKEKNIGLLHINNEVYHLGLEPNSVFLKKQEQAAQTLLKLYKQDKIKKHDNNLLGLFLFLKRSKTNHVLAMFYKAFKNNMKTQLLGKTPSIKLLQLYRISYMCYIDKTA